MATLNSYLIIALMVAVIFGGYEHFEYKQYKTEIEAMGKAQEAAVEFTKKQQALATKGIENVYKSKIDAIRVNYGRMHDTNSGAMPTIPNTTISVNDPTAVIIFAEQCTETTQQLASLQDWINLQVRIK